MFFKNRLQERQKTAAKDAEDARTGVDVLVKREQSRTPINAKDLAPLLKNIKSRSPGASRLWAAAHKDDVDKRWVELGGSPGARQQAMAKLFRALSPDEQAEWKAKAQEVKEQRLNNPDAFFEYV